MSRVFQRFFFFIFVTFYSILLLFERFYFYVIHIQIDFLSIYLTHVGIVSEQSLNTQRWVV